MAATKPMVLASQCNTAFMFKPHYLNSRRLINLPRMSFRPPLIGRSLSRCDTPAVLFKQTNDWTKHSSFSMQLQLRLFATSNDAPAWSPQNVPDPKVVPSPGLSPQQSVEVQLAALQRNDEPWMSHGIQTAYEFCEDAGSMERSRYFGFSKDLYHYDHFQGMFSTLLADLVDCGDVTISSSEARADGSVAVVAEVVGSVSKQVQRYELTLVKREYGRKRGCWMTKSLLQVKEVK